MFFKRKDLNNRMWYRFLNVSSVLIFLVFTVGSIGGVITGWKYIWPDPPYLNNVTCENGKTYSYITEKVDYDFIAKDKADVKEICGIDGRGRVAAAFGYADIKNFESIQNPSNPQLIIRFVNAVLIVFATIVGTTITLIILRKTIIYIIAGNKE